jgi:hypothetical protein
VDMALISCSSLRRWKPAPVAARAHRARGPARQFGAFALAVERGERRTAAKRRHGAAVARRP